MAKQNTSKKLIQKIRESNFVNFWRNEQTRFICGLVLMVLMAYLCIALISFFFTGASDQSIVNNLTFGKLKNATETSNWAGTFGAWISNIIMNKWFGVSSLLLALWGLFASLRLMRVRTISLKRTFIYCVFLFIWLSVFFAFFFIRNDSYIFLGGAHGYYISQWLNSQIGGIGTVLLLLVAIVIFLIFVFKNTIPILRKVLRLSFIKRHRKEPITTSVEEEEEKKEAAEDFSNETSEEDKPTENESSDDYKQDEPDSENFEMSSSDPDPITSTSEKESYTAEKTAEDNPDIKMEVVIAKGDENLPTEDEDPEDSHIALSKNKEYDALKELGEYDPKADLSSFKNPPAKLLKDYEENIVINHEEQQENKRKIIDVLESFGIRISSIQATVGPTVTLYEIIPEAGIRIARIKNLENDIALNLAALGIRIIAPIPGKGTIGIEVPNRNPKIVSMRVLIQSKKFQESKYDLPIVLGKTIMNEVFMFDLCKMPHLLVAGATGQGKSVGLNAIITSLLYKKHPGELKLVMVDPKMVEFSIYSPIEKHYLAKLPNDDESAIITDSAKVIQTLQSLTIEMDDRYKLLNLARCRNIKEYNEKFKMRKLNPEKGHKFMPYIVIIIDEFGDLIMTAGKEIELPIARIAQKARAVGMHMVIATQRPTTNIITGTIKANFPARLAYRVSSVIDSRTILDASGAHQLIGKGDALFSQGNDLTRIQCAFVDTPEVVDIVDFISAQRGYPHAFELPEYVSENGGGGGGSNDAGNGPRDPLFEEAARMIVIHQQGSTSLIQRKFSIGYNRAGRIVDQLETAGIIGPSEGSKARQVLVDDEMHLDMLLSNLNDK